VSEEITAGPVYHFLDLLAQWDTTISRTTQWAVSIVPECVDNGATYDDFFNNVSSYTEIDFTGFVISPNIMRKVLNDITSPNVDGIGLYYAQSVTIPGEGFTIGSVGTPNTGGYLKGVVGQDRMDMASRVVSIDFLETNLDFTAGLIRPWIIAAAHRGLLNTGLKNSIKSTIMVTQMTNSISNLNKRPERKLHMFTGCLPFSVNEDELEYDEEKIIKKKVDFTFTNYQYKVKSMDDNV
jgi:hypothetical protein